MPLYEHVFLARQNASATQVDAVTTSVVSIVEGLGGKVTRTENWGVRALTHRLAQNRKAHFVLLNIDAPSSVIAEIERQERINEDVLRYLTVRVSEFEEGPSAMLRKAERDRGPRGAMAETVSASTLPSDVIAKPFGKPSDAVDSAEIELLSHVDELLARLQNVNGRIEDFLERGAPHVAHESHSQRPGAV